MIKHTTHYRVTVNNKSNVILLDKPLEEAPFFKNPRKYCQSENTTINALVHYGDLRTEYYFSNYKDTIRYFNYMKKMCPKIYEFFNVFDWQDKLNLL